MSDLEHTCKRAMEIGQGIDLSDCHYGETTGPCSYIGRPTKYYYFLAGFVRSLDLRRILEIGTNYGGSIMSIHKGIHKDSIDQSRIATIDIVSKNHEGLSKYPSIKRIAGDSLDPTVKNRVSDYFQGPIDLIYIDSLHEYDHTKDNISSYAEMLNPNYIILDDIRQCDGMKRLWNELKKTCGDNAFDASDISIRKGAGFGVIRWTL